MVLTSFLRQSGTLVASEDAGMSTDDVNLFEPTLVAICCPERLLHQMESEIRC